MNPESKMFIRIEQFKTKAFFTVFKRLEFLLLYKMLRALLELLPY